MKVTIQNQVIIIPEELKNDLDGIIKYIVKNFEINKTISQEEILVAINEAGE